VYRSKFKKSWLPVSVCLSALVGLITSAPIRNAHAQAVCSTALSDGPTWLEATAHVGDTVHFFVSLDAVNNVCRLTGGTNWVITPDGVSHVVVANYSRPACGVVTSFQCPGGAGCINSIPNDGSFFSYTILPGDPGRTLTFTSPRGTDLPTSFSGVPGTIFVGALSDADAFDCVTGASKGKAAGFGTQPLAIVNPCISITKDCDFAQTACGGTNFAYGAPIVFRGTVRNCGDIRLVGVSVTDTPSGPFSSQSAITFDTVQPGGAAFTGSLNPGESVVYHGSYQPSGNLCGPFGDTVVATGTDVASIPKTVSATNSVSCPVCTVPGIRVIKTCIQPTNVLAGATVSYSFIVTNTGDVPLQNVIAVDDNFTPTNPADDITTVIGNLPVRGSAGPFTGTFLTSTANCGGSGFLTNTVRVTGANICNPAQTVSDFSACRVHVICECDLRISKEVACVLPGNTCGTFAKTATGVKDGNVCPAFCYRFTISNPSTSVPLVLTSVIDATVGGASVDLTSQFNAGGPIAPGGSRTISVSPRTHCVNTTNIVTAICTDPDGTQHTVRDTNIVTVLNINLDCVDLLLHSSIDTDGISQGEINGDGSIDPADNNHVELPANTVDAPITLTLTLRNTGTATITVDQLLNLPAGLFDCATGLPIDPTTLVPFDIAPGASTTIVLGCVNVSCPPGASFSISAHGVASTQNDTLCVYNAQGERIGDTSDACPASVTCGVEAACRVTGGGVLLPGTVDNSCIAVNTTIFPSADATHRAVRKITHGGQLGAPFAHMDCGAILGNKCIRGQWSHTRHYEGQGNPRDVIDMTFHSTTPKGIYDSLFCACLGCCDDGAFIPPSAGGKFKKFEICNPDDHKICGPQPRPAPANAIIWSGVGKMTPESDNGANGRNAEWVIFRIYIEDRSEPGGAKPGGAVEPADIYCFQAWKTGIKVSKRPDYNTVWADFRRALGEANCAFVQSLEGSNPAVPIGTLPSPTVNGMTADIQDCGPMSTGNHQIHPVTGADAKCVDAPYQP
jgi:hypothetical protein